MFTIEFDHFDYFYSFPVKKDKLQNDSTFQITAMM